MKSNSASPWQRDELILALDLYFRHHPSTLHKDHREIIGLSRLLNELPIHKERGEKFRNPAGVFKTVWTFDIYDPNGTGKGFSHPSKLSEIVWNEYANDPANLQLVARRIIKGLDSDQFDSAINNDEEIEFPEGKILFRMHKYRERSSKVVQQAKQEALENGRLHCEVCGFDFVKVYGELGEGYIECHHTLPISEYEEDQKTKVEDLSLVCSNCHRMLHRRRP
ncbi:HNH endonuclease [Tumebacillus lipolyticus]|uniref:HNH endonuclease n=1 Tax=Tumebacillus lipolyticus TaxID=1280370 RepID=A0ABW4ZS20_9BACL